MNVNYVIKEYIVDEKLTFKELTYKDIFCDEFKDFKENNVIEFEKNIAVLYGPNGTGKTSLCNILKANNKDANMKFDVVFEGKEKIFEEGKEIFHIIKDQNNRNIIKGEAKDYLLGDNIEKEFALKNEVDKGFNETYSTIRDKMQIVFKIKKKNHKLIGDISDDNINNLLSELATAKNSYKPENINKDDYIKIASTIIEEKTCFNEENELYNFILENFIDNKSIIYKLKNLNLKDIKKNSKIEEIEENDEAIKIIKKFPNKHECIVCDNENYYDNELLQKKEKNKESIIKELDYETKKILEDIIQQVNEERDPLHIKTTLLDAIKKGDTDAVNELIKNISSYINDIHKELANLLKNSLDNELIKKHYEYEELIKTQYDITKEDEEFLINVINDNIDRDINIKRDNNNRLVIYLGESKLTETDRKDIGLSTGEQNFISLAFELLKAKKSDSKYIVLDDPISSFDSIYKNKIAFCIVKFLEDRHQIILTHNTDLIKLLEFQANNCFEFYLFNNTVGELNGFIKVDDKEKELLLKLNKLLELFRSKSIWDDVKDEKLFLVSMIPFMRGYSNITGKRSIYKKLCKVMHGYETETVDLGEIYKSLFKSDESNESEPNLNTTVSVEDILKLEIEKEEIIDKFPLLNRTLFHTLNYLILRLRVENTLCSLEDGKVLNKIKTEKRKKADKGKEYPGKKTQDIINEVFDRNDNTKQKDRVFFTSRKTILNEFNHFEGNMNIFQPAIDITDKALKDEKDAILEKLKELEEKSKLALA